MYFLYNIMQKLYYFYFCSELSRLLILFLFSCTFRFFGCPMQIWVDAEDSVEI